MLDKKKIKTKTSINPELTMLEMKWSETVITNKNVSPFQTKWTVNWYLKWRQFEKFNKLY